MYVDINTNSTLESVHDKSRVTYHVVGQVMVLQSPD